MRIEHDFLGEEKIPKDALYGIHSVRAKTNFPNDIPFHIEWYKAVGLVKLAVFQTYKKFKSASLESFSSKKFAFSFLEDEVVEALCSAAEKISAGECFDHFIVPAIQGGAGTSINMNVNEIIANLALIQLNESPGNYERIDPIEQANIYQSTNDVIPTSLTVAAMKLFVQLEDEINVLRSQIERIETSCRNDLRIAYTQMQEAVPSTYGMLFSTYNEALSRDWWRVSKCFERIKMVNLGGSAIGTGMAVPRFMIMELIQELQRISALPIARSENMPDATTNLDAFVEVHAILKAHAVNLEKMVNDIRLLASDLIGRRELEIPQKQTGSSIMPGKVNPVIPEFVISICHQVYANDQVITHLSAQGCLDLNAYLPSIGHALLESLKLLIHANKSLCMNLMKDLKIDAPLAAERLYHSPSISTALSPFIGYNKAADLAKHMKTNRCDVFQANAMLQLIEEEKLKHILSPQNLLKTGFSLKDL